MPSTIATLGGIPLTAVQRFTWTLTPGTAAHARIFQTSRSSAAAILAQRGQPLEYRVECQGRPVLVVQKLYAISNAPASAPWLAGVLVVDGRYWWTRKPVVGDYNVPRRTGNTRLVGDGRLENRSLIDDIDFAPYSLDPSGKRWTPRAMIEDVVHKVAPDATIPEFKRGVEVYDLIIADPGPMAIDKALAHAAGLAITMDLDGRARVYDARDRSEARVVANAGPIIAGTGVPAMVDRSYSRPSKIISCYEREQEMRLDYIEITSNGVATSLRDETKRPSRSLENVYVNPDPELTLTTGQKVNRGTIIPIDSAFDALKGLEAGTKAVGPLDQAFMRELYMGCWTWTRDRWGTDTAGNRNVPWLRRLGAFRRCWRLKFRILRPFRDMMRSVKPYRVSVIDIERGTRARSLAYMDYVVKPSSSGLYKTASENPDVGHQIAGWAEKLADATGAPAEIVMEDEDQGLFSVNFIADPSGDAEMYAPGNVDLLPNQLVGIPRNVAGSQYATWEVAKLKEGFKLSTVLTCIQASPKDIGRYHQEEVMPEDAEQVLGQKIGDCKGEPWYVLVGGNVATGRFAWLDERATDIEESFYTGKGKVDDLCLNRDQLQARAKANAAAIYGSMLDRVQGAFSVALNPAIEITGALSIVEHAVDVDGSVLTTLALLPELEPPAPMAFIPASIQRAERKMVQT